MNNQTAEDLLKTLTIDRVHRVPRKAGWHYLRVQFYDAAKRLRYRLSVLTDKETNEMLLLRTK